MLDKIIDQLKEHLLVGMSIALIILALLTSASSGLQWRNDWRLAHAPILRHTKFNTHHGSDIIAAIPKAHLFGKAMQNTGDVPLTNLQLRVTGIVKSLSARGDAPPTSKAYISISGQPGKIFLVGDHLPYGVEVYQITKNSVILNNHGRLEKLLLPRSKLQFKLHNKQEL